MATALGDGWGLVRLIGNCACLRRELSGEPDVGNLHLRFDEGRVGRATRVALSPTLPVQKLSRTPNCAANGMPTVVPGPKKSPSAPAGTRN